MIQLKLLLNPKTLKYISKVARTTHFRKIEKVLESYIFLKSRRLEKSTGACFAETGPLVKILSNFKVGASSKNRLSI